MILDIIESNKEKEIDTEKVEALKKIIPGCFDKEGKLDIELLKKELKDDIDFTKESFELNFLGKSYAKMIAGLDTETVLEPDVEHNGEDVNRNSNNIYISGDNIDALKHLQKAYEGKIKCIYIDPPYNTGNDGFVYSDSFKFSKEDLIEKLDISEDEADRIINMTSGKSSSHSAWLTFMSSRLILAKNLLSDDGVICISIDDNELNDLKLLCDGIFGEENFVGNIVRATGTTTGQDANKIGSSLDYCLVYSKTNNFSINGIPLDEEDEKRFNEEDENGKYSVLQLRKTGNSDRKSDRPKMFYPVEAPDGSVVYPFGPDNYLSRWRVQKETYDNLVSENMIVWKKNNKEIVTIDGYTKSEWTPYVKYYLDGRTKQISNLLQDIEGNKKGSLELKELFEVNKIFDNPKPIEFIEILINVFSNDNDTVLDFFSGSATTAHTILNINAKNDSNRKFILVQIPEEFKENSTAYLNGYRHIDELGQERIKRAAKKIKEETNANIDYGFKHYTLKNTPDDLLNKLEMFNPKLLTESFDLYKQYGIDTILETWKLKDGYEFTENIEEIDLDGYKAYRCNECLYLINPQINVNNIQVLLQKYSDDDNFTCNKLIMFGYSFSFEENEMVKNNIKQVKNYKNIDIKVYTRY